MWRLQTRTLPLDLDVRIGEIEHNALDTGWQTRNQFAFSSGRFQFSQNLRFHLQGCRHVPVTILQYCLSGDGAVSASLEVNGREPGFVWLPILLVDRADDMISRNK